MSVIRKTPYIESVLASMTDANLASLRSVLNSGGDNVNLSFKTLTNSYKNTVTPVYFQFEDNGLKTGILIWTDTKCCLICYHKYQDLLLLELNPTAHTWKKINEYCDINELRRVLDDTIEAKGVIESGGADANTVLTADGDGGTSWKAPLSVIKDANTPEGSAQYLLGLDENGNVIKDELPEGIVVDQTVVEDSANAVAGGAVYDFAYSKTDVDAMLETKANVDGNYPTMTVGAADNLTPYDESAGDDQDEPFSFQATGTGNGSQADFATGALALMKEKRGNSVVVNQLLKPRSEIISQTGVTSPNDNTVIFNNNALAIYELITVASLIKGHKHLLHIKFTEAIGNAVNFYWYEGTQVRQTEVGVNYDRYVIYEETRDDPAFNLRAYATGNCNGSLYFCLIDLTQWFGGDIPQDLLSHPENFFRYYQGSLARNTGTLVNANSRYIKCIGRQQWDEEWENGDLDISTGQPVSSSTYIRSKNFTRVNPNSTYYLNCENSKNYVFFYDKDQNFISYYYPGGFHNSTFNVPANCCYIKVTSNQSSYTQKITISLYYEGESGYDQYYPYEVLTNNDTGTEELKSAGSVADSKTPDGTITRKVGSVDLGSLSWTYVNPFWRADLPLSKIHQNSDVPNGICNTYPLRSLNDIYVINQYIGIFYNGIYVCVNNGSSSIEPTGILYYELATSTEEQGTPFSENLVIDDFGSMEFSGTSGVPQGNLIFYPVDYKAFIDTLYDYTEGTPSDIALKSDLTVVEEKIGAKLPECPTTTDGTYVLKATVSDGTVTYTWVLEA